jgi:hypothetical protein
MIQAAARANSHTMAAPDASRLSSWLEAGIPAFPKINDLRRTDGSAEAVLVAALLINLNERQGILHFSC